MQEDIQIEILGPEEILGSANFAIAVRVANISTEELSNLSIEPVLLPGRLVRLGDEKDENPLSEVELTKRRLVREMERQVYRAYERNRFRRLGTTAQFSVAIRRALEVYVTLFTIGSYQRGAMIPTWAVEALRIQDWDDVERLEADVISDVPEESFLRKAFLINKDKLRRCLAQIQDQTKGADGTKTLDPGDSLLPGASSSYPFTLKAPHALRARMVDTQFRVTFRKGAQTKLNQKSIGKSFRILSSAFAVPTGSMIGALCGYGIRIGLKATTASGGSPVFNWGSLGGSVLLGLVFALLTSRKAEAKKPITVEDFVGGFLIGTASGLFSDEVLKRVGNIFQ